MQSNSIDRNEQPTPLDTAMLITDICIALRILDKGDTNLPSDFHSNEELNTIDGVLEVFKSSKLLSASDRLSIIVFASKHTAFGDKLAEVFCEITSEPKTNSTLNGYQVYVHMDDIDNDSNSYNMKSVYVLAKSMVRASMIAISKLAPSSHELVWDDFGHATANNGRIRYTTGLKEIEITQEIEVTQETEINDEFIVVGCPAFGEIETHIVQAESFELAAKIAAQLILEELHDDYNDSIYIYAVIDRNFNTKTDLVFEVEELI